MEVQMVIFVEQTAVAVAWETLVKGVPIAILPIANPAKQPPHLHIPPVIVGIRKGG